MGRTSGRPSAGGRTNLPHELTPFRGRERELNELVRLANSARLISLLGPAGIGKSRLAARLAAMLSRRFPDGAWLIQLASVADGELLPAVIAGVLDIPEVRPGETLAVLDAALASRQVLLLFDNCEHLVDRVAVAMDHLLRTCPGLTVLLTSRERVGVVGELTWRVPPLEIPRLDHDYSPGELERVEAVQLFVDRATRASPHFVVSPANAGDLVDLVRRLDGLPLALELAAGWMETLSPGELARELDQRYQILAARDRAMSERHSSLWTAIDSSYERLDPPARDLFCQLGVFAGGWNLGAMSAVCRLESAPAVEVLGRLVDHSFVTVVPTTEGPTRYRLLNILRHFALASLDLSGLLEATQRRFAEHVVTLAETASGTLTRREGPRWLTVLDAELENVRAVFAMSAEWAADLKLRLAVALVPYWHFRGLFNEGRRRLGEVLAGNVPSSTATAAAHNGLSRLAWAQGEVAAAARHARDALRVARRIDDQRGATYALLRLAQARFDGARPAAASRATERAAEIAADLADERLTGDCVLQLGQLAIIEGRLDEADRLLQESVRLLSRTGHVDREAVALQALGRLYLRQSRIAEAEAALLGSMTVLRDFALVRHSVPMLEGLAAVAAERQDHGRAARLAGAAEGLMDRMGVRPPRTAPMRNGIVARWQVSLEAPGAGEAFAEGRHMELRQAIAFALGEVSQSEGRARRRPEAARPVLTRRQLQVARLVARALSNKEIGAQLGLSERTVEGHVEQICNRLGFNSRVQIGVWMAQAAAEE